MSSLHKLQLSLWCISLLTLSLMSASGFSGDTLITTANGRLKPIKELCVNEEVVCYDNNFQLQLSLVKGIGAYTVSESVEITTNEAHVLQASLFERFYLPHEDQWVFAKDLKEGDCLLNENFEAVPITLIHRVAESKEFFIVTVEKYHNFLASKGRYIVHNGPICGWVAYWATKTFIYGVAVAAVGGVFAATGGTVGVVASSLAAGATSGASTGATMVAAAVTKVGLVSEATTATIGVISSAGGVAGAAAATETASVAVGSFFTCIPFLP